MSWSWIGIKEKLNFKLPQEQPQPTLAGLWSKNGLLEVSHTGLEGQPPGTHLSQSVTMGRPLGQACSVAELS